MTRITDPKHKFLRRICKEKGCGKTFQPVSKYNHICPMCIEEKRKKRWGK